MTIYSDTTEPEGFEITMIEDFFEDISVKDKFIGWSIIAIPILVLTMLELFFLRPTPIPPDLVPGCYVASGAPSLTVYASSISIDGSKQAAFSYTAEPDKLGYRLSVSPAISLRPDMKGGYLFAKDERGIGYFWPMLTVDSDDPRSLRDPAQYGGRFRIIATDGASVVYRRTQVKADCAERQL